MEKQEHIKERLDVMQAQLNKLMDSYECANYEEILELSRKVDELIVLYMQIK